MEKYNSDIRLYWHDRILAATVLRLIPQRVTPNSLTIARFMLTPAVIFCIANELYSWGIPLFILTALTDALDGSLARTRRQITEWGIVYDPIADKLLVSSVLFLFVMKHLNFALGVAIVTMEVVSGLTALVYKRRGYVYMASILGKTKMILQVVGVSLLLLWAATRVLILYNLSFIVLLASLGFAVVNVVTFVLRKSV